MHVLIPNCDSQSQISKTTLFCILWSCMWTMLFECHSPHLCFPTLPPFQCYGQLFINFLGCNQFITCICISYFILQGGTQQGAFTTTPAQRSYNDGQWHYIKVTRIGNAATLTDELGQELASVTSCKLICSR